MFAAFWAFSPREQLAQWEIVIFYLETVPTEKKRNPQIREELVKKMVASALLPRGESVDKSLTLLFLRRLSPFK